MDPDYVVVFTAQGEVEEQQVCSFLNANGIPTMVHGEALRKTHAFVLDGLGEVQVLVRREHEASARELLERVARGELAVEDEA